jgi:hypothetical protein
MNMRCQNCREKNDDSSRYCHNCGYPLANPVNEEVKVEEVMDFEVLPKDKDNEQQDAYKRVKDDHQQHGVICPKCGSTGIHFITREKGANYSASNACCGYIIFGPFGLLCGLFSDKKTETIRKCMRCNHEF